MTSHIELRFTSFKPLIFASCQWKNCTHMNIVIFLFRMTECVHSCSVLMLDQVTVCPTGQPQRAPDVEIIRYAAFELIYLSLPQKPKIQ